MSKMSRSEAGYLGAIKTNALWPQRYKENPKRCRKCESELPYEKRHNKFCNQSCAASHNNLGVCRNGTSDLIEQFCLGCNVLIRDNRSRKYCAGASCQAIHRWLLRKAEIEQSGEEKSVVCAKRFLRETRGEHCEICEMSEWCGQKIPLIMDHIDGNSDNNQMSNLRLVCGNCDMQLPTYKAKNKGNGRHSRRVRYQEGKSY